MATPTPWQLASAGQKSCPPPPIPMTHVFTRGTEPWPYYQPPVPLVTSTGSEAATYGVYGANSQQAASSASGGSSGGSGGSGGNFTGNAGPGTGTGGGSPPCPD